MAEHPIYPTTRPQTLDEILSDDTSSPPSYPALDAWEEEQRVKEGMPTGDLKLRVSYLNQQHQLDPANRTRLIREQVTEAAKAAGNSVAPAWQTNSWVQGDPELDQLTQNVAYLADRPEYENLDSGTMLKHLSSGWNPSPLPSGPIPGLNPLQSIKDGGLNAYHDTRANMLDSSAVAQGFGGYDQSAEIQHNKAVQQRGVANDHAAPPENARLADKFLWHTANFATEAVPWILGGIPGIGTRAATKAVVSGVGKLAKRSFGAVPATVETTGATYDELLKKGFHPEQARELALEFGAGAGVANMLTYQFPTGPSQPIGERVLAEGTNQVIQEVGESIPRHTLRGAYGLDD